MALFGAKYACETCGMKFKTEAELRQHGSVHMPAAAKPSGETACPMCGATFRNSAELMQHKQKAHPM